MELLLIAIVHLAQLFLHALVKLISVFLIHVLMAAIAHKIALVHVFVARARPASQVLDVKHRLVVEAY